MLRSALVILSFACSAAGPVQPSTPQGATATPQATAPDATMLRYPDVGPERIVFVYANDLWTVDRAGGQASPLASPPGTEQFPKFSADGSTIAFMGNYEGGRDLYTIPSIGGVPVRVTHHPARETLNDWTPDGELLFYAGGMSGLGRQQKLFTVGAGGGLPEALPLPYATVGAIAPDGKWLAYTPYTRDARTWKRYRGGMATDIRLFNLETYESRVITDWEGTDSLPMWHGTTIYYLSDQGEGNKTNLWAYDTASGQREQVTRFTDYDVKWPSIGPGERGQGEIVFQKGAELHLLDLATKASRAVAISIPGAMPTLRTKQVDASKFIQSWNVSPSAKRAAVQARGDIWTLPAEKGSPRNLTRTSGVAERRPSWSPDGRWIAYFSDETGEYEVYITQSDGKGGTRKLTSGLAPFYYGASWSPDSKHILLTDKSWRLHLVTVESGEVKLVAQDPWALGTGASWSHDSRWIAYSMGTEEEPVPRIWLYEVETGAKHAVTAGAFPDSSPIFDRHGDYLYFVSGRAFSPTGSNLFMDDNFIYEDTQQLLAVPLLEEIESPWLPESDEESWDEEEEENGEEEDEAEEDEEAGDDEEAEDEKTTAEPDAVSGTWEGTASTPDGEVSFVLVLKLGAGNDVTGSLSSIAYSGDITGMWDPGSKTLNAVLNITGEVTVVLELTIDGESMSGTGTAEGESVPIEATRTSTSSEDEGEDGDEKKKGKAREKVEIDIEGFERRADVSTRWRSTTRTSCCTSAPARGSSSSTSMTTRRPRRRSRRPVAASPSPPTARSCSCRAATAPRSIRRAPGRRARR